MTKTQWQAHAKAAGPHDRTTCPDCAARRKTRARNDYARERDDAMKSIGLVRGRDSMGRTIWE